MQEPMANDIAVTWVALRNGERDQFGFRRVDARKGR